MDPSKTTKRPVTLAQASRWLVAKADTNGNGVIGAGDAKHSAVARALIAKADTNHTGALSKAELTRFATRFAGADHRLSATEFQRMARAIAATTAPTPTTPAAPAAPVPGAAPATPTPASGDLSIDGIAQTQPLSARRADGYRAASMPTSGGGGGQSDSLGNLYVATGAEVRVFDSANQLTRRIRLPFAAADVAPSPDGSTLYVTHNDGGVYKPERLVRGADGSYAVDPSFQLEAFPYGGVMQHAEGMRIATDGSGNLYVADGTWSSNLLHTVVKFTPEGKYVTRFGEYADGNKGDASTWDAGRFYWALGGIAVSRDGSKVFTTEIGNNRVQRWDAQADGTYGVGAMWGATQQTDPDRVGSAEPGQFAAPYDIGLDGEDNVYVMNTTATQIQKFTTDGTYLTSMFLGSSGPDVQGPSTERGHGIAVTARGDAVSVESGRMMEHVG
jgi:hypothetical protein